MKKIKFDFSVWAIVLIAIISIWSLVLSGGNDNDTRQILQEIQALQKNMALNSVLTKQSNNETNMDSDENNNASYDNGMAIIQGEIRNILKTELKGFLAELKDEDGFEYQDVQKKKVRTKASEKEQKVSYERSLEIVHNAIGAGKWTHEDARNIRARFRKLSKEKKTEVLQALIPAINRGEIAVETKGLF